MNAQRNDNDGPRRGKSAETGEDVTTLESRPDDRPVTVPPPSEAAPAPPPRKGFGRIFFLLLAAGLAGLLYYYWGFWEKLPFFQGAQQTAAAPPPPKVTVAKPLIRELIESKDFTGQFEAVDFVDVRARVSGYLESINFIDGQTVKKGDLLFVPHCRAEEKELRHGRDL
jgi:hypothetical protein